MQDFKLVFVESDNMEQTILGRKAKDYLFNEFQDYEYQIVQYNSVVENMASPLVVLSLDMPLVTEEYIVRTLNTMKSKGIGRVVFGGEDSSFGVFVKEGKSSFFCSHDEILKLGGSKSYNIVYNTLRERIISSIIDGGAYLIGEEFHIDSTVLVEEGATLVSPLTLKGDTHIMKGAVVENSIVSDSIISEGATVTSSHLTASQVGENSSVGPFARLRGAVIGANCRIGDFVEVKNSTFYDGVKSAHLSYVGDSEVGEKTNVGCGTVFCNYDGKLKHRSKIGEGCFIGANVNLVAPITVGDRAYIAAGTTVTKDVADGEFVIGRVRAECRDKINAPSNVSNQNNQAKPT